MMPAISLRDSSFRVITSGQQFIPDIRVGGAVDYIPLEMWADGTATLTGAKVWLTVDAAGVAVALSVPDSTPRDQSYAWSLTYSSLSYSTPTTQAGGIALPTLAPGQKTLVVLRRSPDGGTEATPERNTLRLGGGVWS